jgi:hypothetical protein
MIDKLTLKSTHRFCERGSILPVALGMGAIMSLAAGTMLVRSYNDQISVATSDAIVKSQTVAELGINRYKDLINHYRGEVPIHPACDEWSSDGTCSDAPSIYFGSWMNNAELLVPEADVEEFKEIITRTWQNVSDNPQDGQYRLFDYTVNYTPYSISEDGTISEIGTTGTGILTVEGRVNQGADGTEGSGTATRRLRVQFPITLHTECDDTTEPGDLCIRTRIGPNSSWEIVPRE